MGTIADTMTRADLVHALTHVLETEGQTREPTIDRVMAVIDPVLPDRLRPDMWPLRTNPQGLHPADPGGVDVKRHDLENGRHVASCAECTAIIRRRFHPLHEGHIDGD